MTIQEAALTVLSYRGRSSVSITYPIVLQGRKRPTLFQKAEAVQEVMGAVNRLFYEQWLADIGNAI